jgi:hypothetical protein
MGDPRRLPKLLYESLPLVYVVAGLTALVWSYREGTGALSLLCAALGLAGVVGGCVLALRRRDYRRMRSMYGGTRIDPEGPGS